VTDRKIIVAVLDDESKMRTALKRLLGTHGFEIALCESWEDFVATVQDHRPDCLLLDLHMPGYSGFDILGMMAGLRPPVPTVVVTGRDEPGTDARVRALGAVNYLLKPLDESTLVQAIHAACGLSAPPPVVATPPAAGR
jgi:FixJ family two-component response regulator